MILRRERPDDIATIAEIHRRAFSALGFYDGPPVEDRLVDALRADPGWVPAMSIVAEDDDGDVIGHVVATEGRLGDVPAVGIGPSADQPTKEKTMKNYIPEPERLRAAQFVTAMSAVQYSAYPDPSTPSGWAEVPAVMLLVDFAGREDIVYAAMMNAASLPADDLELRITPPSDSGTSLYLMTITFEGEEPLDIAGVADPEAIGMFAEAELLLLASVDQEHDDGAPVLALGPNDRAQWTSHLATHWA